MKIKEYLPSFIRAYKLKRYTFIADDRVNVDCVVSLTSIEPRLGGLHLVIKSLLSQSYLPSKIILWLNHSLKVKLPKSLLQLEGEIFEIRFRDQQCPHRKLIFSLQEFSSNVIVTCDDDAMYHEKWLQRLYEDHLQYPLSIIAHECREIRALSNELLPYTDWPSIQTANISSPNFLPIGYGGVLYPIGVMHCDTINQDLYMHLSPNADDLWFKAMSLLNGVSVKRSSNPAEKPVPIIGAKRGALAKTNIQEDGNRLQWQAICDHYKINPDCS